MSSKFLSLLLKGALLIMFGVCLLVVLFFANGYSFDFVGQIIRKTGLIQIEYRDSAATVSLDGVALNGKLPFVISGVLPGKHYLKIEKADYGKWEKEIEVKEDLISRVDGVFLLPEDEDKNLKLLLEVYPDSYKIIFVNKYLVLINSTQLKYVSLDRNISWATLNSIDLPFDPVLIDTTTFYDHFVKFTLNNGKTSLFDLNNGQWFDKPIQPGFTYSGNNWYYLKDKLFAVYDKNLTRLIQANRFEKSYQTLLYESFDGRDWFLLGGPVVGDLYLKKDAEMLLIADQIVDFLPGTQDKILYIRDDFTLWEYSVNTGKKLLLTRFSDGFKLLGNNFQINQNSLGWFYKYDQKYWFADKDWANIQKIAAGLDLVDIKFKNPGQLYLLVKSKNAQQKDLLSVYLLDLEN